MVKNLTIYICQSCGHKAPKWLGKCPECSEWNSLVEEKVSSSSSSPKNSLALNLKVSPLRPLNEISSTARERMTTGIDEFDRTLGGGIVSGSLILIGGDPGIGKSTLVLQSMAQLAESGETLLYVSGEESLEQIKMRADRLKISSNNLLVYSEICIEEVLKKVDEIKPDLLVLDSIQTFFTSELQSAPGSIGQVREVAFKLFKECKQRSLPAIIIGHITKEGAIAGPKSLEHMVDCVLYFEGERGHSFRILRAIKNRFGSTPEMGVFEMGLEGLIPVSNPSEIFLAERPENSTGSVIAATLEGSRPLLVEVQALVTASSTVGMPRRVTSNLDPNRINLLVAIMEKRLELNLQREDIFVNLAGGIKVTEPAMDLALATAIASSFQNLPVDSNTIMIGEVGLTGEVRSVMQLDSRLKEAAKLGFKRVVIPESAKKSKFLSNHSIELIFVKSLQEAFEAVL